MVAKKRGIVKKPTEQTAADWVSAGGADPELEKPVASKAKGRKSTVKSKDPDYTQIGVYLPNELHRQMKIGAATTGMEMSEIAAAGIQMWLDENLPNN